MAFKEILSIFALLPFISSTPAEKYVFSPNAMHFPDAMPALVHRSELSSVYQPNAFLEYRWREIKARFRQQFIIGLDGFQKRLYTQLRKTNAYENLIYSPLSMQTCLAMVRMGTYGRTASEIDGTFSLIPQIPSELANSFQSILKDYAKNSSSLTIANKFYVMDGFEVKNTYSDVLRKQFFSSVENVNFGDSDKAARTINTWVANKTGNLINDLIAPESLGSDTHLVLVNAIHFKGEWQDKFDKLFTEKKLFNLDESNTVEVEMMQKVGHFLYGDFPELGATALEMPYSDSDLSLVVILPYSPTGLALVEEKLKRIPFAQLSRKMSLQSVGLSFPKFKAELEVELSDALKNLGVQSMFSKYADFGGMLQHPGSLQVSKVIHKTFIEFNEEGTSAAAATGMDFSFRMLGNPSYEFSADRPFVYCIKNSKDFIIFSGNVLKI